MKSSAPRMASPCSPGIESQQRPTAVTPRECFAAVNAQQVTWSVCRVRRVHAGPERTPQWGRAPLRAPAFLTPEVAALGRGVSAARTPLPVPETVTLSHRQTIGHMLRINEYASTCDCRPACQQPRGSGVMPPATGVACVR